MVLSRCFAARSHLRDAGEPFFNGENKHGFDFNSVYFRVNEVWKFKHIIVGDFQVKTGQGIGLWSGLAFGKSPDIINIRNPTLINTYNFQRKDISSYRAYLYPIPY